MPMQFSIKISVKDPKDPQVQSLGNLRLRVICEWADCCILSETLGTADVNWVETVTDQVQQDQSAESKVFGASSTIFTSTLTRQIEPKVAQRHILEAFNKEPGIYAVLLKETKKLLPPEVDPTGNIIPNVEPKYIPQLVPIGFLYADCSIFLLETENPVYTESLFSSGLVRAQMTISSDAPLISSDVALPLAPLIIDLQQISGYPLLEGEHSIKMQDHLYVQGVMDIGGLSILRKFYMRPRAENLDMAGPQDSHQKAFIAINSRICILPGLVNLPRFKEALTSSTYNLGIYHEDLFSRAFHTAMIEEYHTALSLNGSSPLQQPPGMPNKADGILYQAISHALTGSSHICPHGQGPFRLEHLLSSSEDLLKEFAMRRRGKQTGDEVVTLREEIVSEVRLCRPSKPLRWKTPDDISLRSALNKVKGLQEIVKAQYVKPRHERFDESGTVIILSTELRRALKHPDPIPKIMHKPAEMESLTKSLSQARLDSTLKLSEEEQRLSERLQLTPFTRMVFVLKFDDDETLLAINNAITKVNSAALPDIQGSLRSYSFTETELKGCTDGTLDVVTGFMIIDDDMRIAVLEGLAAPGCGMQSVFLDIPRQKANDGTLKILANPEVLYPARLYGEFGPDLKRIRIRNKLKKLARRPELYNRKQVELRCFDAIDNIMSLRWAPDMLSTKELDLYPPADSLNKVELLYGEAISRSDLDGTAAEAQRRQQLKEKKAIMEARKLEETYPDDAGQSLKLQTSQSVSDTTEKKQEKRRDEEHRCGPTDCRNPEFEKMLSTRPEHRVDYLSEQKKLLKEAYEQALQRMARREEVASETLVKVLGPDGDKAKIYVYGSQAQSFMAKALRAMRDRINSEKMAATYTFSKDFISQTVCLVDEDADRVAIKAEKASHWLTPSGFQYPKPKTSQDLLTHPKRPSDSRIDELKEAWEGDLPKGMKTSNPEDIANLQLERGYTNRIRGGELFGKLKEPTFTREFDLKLVGDRKSLPRGHMVDGNAGDKDPQAFRSVHLGGEGQAKLIAEAEEAEKKAWRDKVVVDTLSVQVGGFVTRDKTLQFQRTDDILHDEPKRKELIHLRTRKSVGGRDFSYAPAPYSIISQGQYTGNGATALQRTKDPTKWTLTAEGETKDFVRFIDRNANAPRIMCVLSAHKELTKLAPSEMTGPKWSSNAASMQSTEAHLTPHEDYLARRAQAKKNKFAAKNQEI